ncbi:MAG: trypsin-like serine protease [Fimbriimonadales bacterium]|nr:trypsin-like serine protease [Fimbriimonadales bacterium]
MMIRWALRLVLVACASGPLLLSKAVVPDLPTSNWPYAGQFGTEAQKWSGVAIGDRWVLTARHVAFMGDTEGRFVMDGGPAYSSIKVYQHPTDDIAVIEFSNPFPGWYPIYTGSSEIGMIGEVVGYGVTGEIINGEYQYTGGAGVKRAGRNRISLIQFLSLGGVQGNFMICDFDGSGRDTFGDGGPVENECTLGGGDSGGPTFVNDGGVWKVAGIHSWVGNVQGGPTPPKHGSLFGDIRVSAYAQWIKSIVPERITPASVTIQTGVGLGDGLMTLWFSDDSRYRVREAPPLALGLPSVRVTVSGNSPIQSPSKLTFRLEASTSAAPANAVTQQIELRNHQSNTWELVDSRASTASDNMIVVTPSGDPTRFVQPGTGLVQARLSWFDPGSLFSFGWQARIDMAIWEILP